MTHFPLIIAAQGDTITHSRVRRALATVFDNGLPDSLRIASPYALIFSLRADDHRSRMVRIDFDALFDYYSDERSNTLGTFSTKNAKLLRRMADLSYEYLRELHSSDNRTLAYVSLQTEAH